MRVMETQLSRDCLPPMLRQGMGVRETLARVSLAITVSWHSHCQLQPTTVKYKIETVIAVLRCLRLYSVLVYTLSFAAMVIGPDKTIVHKNVIHADMVWTISTSAQKPPPCAPTGTRGCVDGCTRCHTPIRNLIISRAKPLIYMT